MKTNLNNIMHKCSWRNFISPNLWPPNSPHLNPPVDYKIWGTLQRTGVQDQNHERERATRSRIVDAALSGTSAISASSTKTLESGEQVLELVMWLQVEDS